MNRLPSRRAAFRIAAALLILLLAAPQAWGWYHLRAAKAALAKSQPERARKSLSACERVWADRPSIRLLASRAARQDGDFETAASELRACQRCLGQATDETAFEWALLQASTGDVREVEEYLHKRAELSPEESPLVWEALAEGYLRVYRTLDAMACLDHWLKRDENNVRALELRGMTYVAGKGVLRGTQDYRRVLELDPGRTKTRWLLATSLISLGGYDEAADLLETSRKEKPGDPEIASRLSRCYIMLQRGDEARVLLDETLASHPNDGLCLRTRGQLALLEPNGSAEAEALLRRAAAAMPEDYQTQWFLFQSLLNQGKIEEAKEQHRRADDVKDRMERIGELRSRKLAEQPLDPALHYEMGLLLMRTGHPDVGERWFKTALDLDPNHGPSHAALADYYEGQGKKNLAAEHRRQVGN